MKKQFLFLLLIGLFFSCKKLLPTKILPYSMVQFQPQKFVDKTELTVEQYAEFVFDGNEQHKPLKSITEKFSYYELFYPSSTPDSLYKAYGKIGYYKLPVIREYFDTLKYGELRRILDFPISGISYENAQAYCQWRTKRYKNNTTHTKKGIRFELPDSAVLPPFTTRYKQNKWKRKVPLANLKGLHYEVRRDAPSRRVHETIGVGPVKTRSFAQNMYGVYDLYGNVAEMSRKKGIAYGGSYLNTPTELKTTTYSTPQPWLGFRCVGIVED